MNWCQQWIDEVLARIPAGSFRIRMEAELRDHLEMQCRDLMKAGRTEARARTEALRAMGEPDKLREEYGAAWRRTLPGRLEALKYRLRAWAIGCVIMFVGHFLVSYALGCVWRMAISLPADSRDLWVRLIRDTAGTLNNSLLWQLLPLVSALIAGACYLGLKFRASRRPVWQIGVGLSLHWASIAAIQIGWEAMDDHMTFWEELKVYLTCSPGYYLLTLALCALLGVVFGHLCRNLGSRPLNAA